MAVLIRLCRALVALALLIAILVGIPVVLVTLSADLLPHSIDLNAPVLLLGSPDDGRLLISVLIVVAWLAWASLAVSVLVEVPAQLRRVRAPRIRGLRLQQQVVSGLVAAVLGAIITPTALAATPTSSFAAIPGSEIRAASASSAGVGWVPGIETDKVSQVRVSKARGPATTHEVQQGESLWLLADRFLGSGAEWPQILRANQRLIADPQLLRTGWVLDIPGSAPAAAQAVPTRHPPRPSASAHDSTYVVRSGDSLWGIADEQLGDPGRWLEIAKANDRLIRDPGLLRVGWTLTIPSIPRSAAQRGDAERRDAERGDAERGDAERGDAGRRDTGRRDAERSASHRNASPEEASPRSRSTWDASDLWRASETGSTAPQAETPERHSPGPAERITLPGTTPLAVSPTGNPPESAPASPAAPRARAAAEDSASSRPSIAAVTNGSEKAVAAAETGAVVRTALGTGAVLAAGIVGLLLALRRNQGRRRLAGERLAYPEMRSLRETEAQFQAVADTDGVLSLDRALRRLAVDHRTRDVALPRLRAVRLTPSHIELYLSQPALLPAPWTDLADGTVWALRHVDVTTGDVEDDVDADTRAPYPALVTVGQDEEDAHLLLDLEEVASLSVHGTPEEVDETFAAMTLELATSRWADDIQITLVGVLHDLPPAVPTGRIRYIDHVELLMAELEARVRDVDTLMEAEGVGDLRHARGRGLAEDAWTPEILMLGSGVPEHLHDRLRATIHRVPGVGLAAVTRGSTPLGEWSLTDRSGEQATLEPAGIRLRPQRMPTEEVRAVLQLLRGAEAPATAGPGWSQPTTAAETTLEQLRSPWETDPLEHESGSARIEHEIGTTQLGRGIGTAQAEHDTAAALVEREAVPAHPEPAESAQDPDPQPTTTTAGPDEGRAPSDPAAVASVRALPATAPRLSVLGVPGVEGASGPEPTTHEPAQSTGVSQKPKATELVGYLSTHRHGASLAELARALYPGHPLGLERTAKLVSRTRRWLGLRGDGRPWLARAEGDGLIVLAAEIRTDWDGVLDAIGPSLRNASDARLRAAAELITGTPLAGVPRGSWAWAEEFRHDIVAGSVDLLHEIAERAIRRGDPATARRAVSQGRELDPDNELLWRDALRAGYVTGDPEEQARLTAQLLAQADELQIDLDPATEDLLVDLQRASGQ